MACCGNLSYIYFIIINKCSIVIIYFIRLPKGYFINIAISYIISFGYCLRFYFLHLYTVRFMILQGF